MDTIKCNGHSEFVDASTAEWPKVVDTAKFLHTNQSNYFLSGMELESINKADKGFDLSDEDESRLRRLHNEFHNEPSKYL
jgi:hypothetical protein